MNTTEATPLSQQILQRLSASNLRTKSKKAVGNLVDACDFLQKHNVEICVSAVGKICAGKVGGPATQSIRNSDDYRAYVIARRSEQALQPARRKEAAAGPFRTGDINIDAHLQTLEFELMKAKADLKNLRQALPRMGEFDLKAAIEQGHLVINAPAIESLSSVAKEALESLLSEAVLSRVGLTLVKTGQIISPEFNDAVLLTKSHVDALRALIGRRTPPAAEIPIQRGEGA